MYPNAEHDNLRQDGEREGDLGDLREGRHEKEREREKIEKPCSAAWALGCGQAVYSPDGFSPATQVIFIERINISQTNGYMQPGADRALPPMVNI